MKLGQETFIHFNGLKPYHAAIQRGMDSSEVYVIPIIIRKKKLLRIATIDYL
jgi:hypothetical protein